MSQEFEYKWFTEPDSIRLIDLKPSLDYTAEIRCSLIHTALSSGHLRDVFNHYTALSYVWGSAENVETIWVDENPLKITASLFSALRDLRDETRSFFLWADGICINQNDDKEKGLQVQLMGCIYAEASNMIIYLGPADLDGQECRCLLSIRDSREPSDVDTLSSIFQKEWFTRVWVFQELVFASNPWVQCGRARAKWAAILEKGVAVVPEHPRKIASQMQRAWLAYHLSRQKSTMLELVQARRGLGVSDPRDMIFAHVGFAADGEGLMVDYSKTCAQVFTDFALHTAERNGFITMLNLVWDSTTQPRLQDLPSWVPDLTTLSPTLRLPMSESPGWEHETKITPWGKNPAFVSRDCNRINVTTSELSLSRLSSNIRRIIASKLAKTDDFLDSEWVQIESENMGTLKAIWEEVYQIWGGLVGTDILPQLDLGTRGHNIWCFTYPLNFGRSIWLYLIMAFDTRLDADYLRGRALAKTDDGMLALVPVATQKGDFIAPFVEGPDSKLFIFRPVDYIDADEDSVLVRRAAAQLVPEFYEGLEQQVLHCELVGECFVEEYWQTIGNPLVGDNRRFIIEIH